MRSLDLTRVERGISRQSKDSQANETLRECRKPKKKRTKEQPAGINPVYEKMNKGGRQKGKHKDLSRIRTRLEYTRKI